MEDYKGVYVIIWEERKFHFWHTSRTQLSHIDERTMQIYRSARFVNFEVA